jgi:hypothetical protein
MNDREEYLPGYFRTPTYSFDSFERFGDKIVANFDQWLGDQIDQLRVEFPIDYLARDEADWQAELRATVEAKRAQEAAAEAQRKADAEAQRREKDLADLARLQAKYPEQAKQIV